MVLIFVYLGFGFPGLCGFVAVLLGGCFAFLFGICCFLFLRDLYVLCVWFRLLLLVGFVLSIIWYLFGFLCSVVLGVLCLCFGWLCLIGSLLWCL